MEARSKPLELQVIAKWNKARATILTLPHHTVKTPVFMPVGTQGSVKGVTVDQLLEVIFLVNLLNSLGS